MTLRRQLLIVSLLLLTLPWAGCQFVREMEGALRKGQEQALQASATAVATLLSDHTELLYPYAERRSATPDPRQSVYARQAQQPVIIDGYGDGWEPLPATAFHGPAENTSRADGGTHVAHPAANTTISYKAQRRGDTLYLLFDVRDDDIVYHHPGRSATPNGDRLVLRLWPDQHRQDYIIATAAPGPVRAYTKTTPAATRDPARIRGVWQDAVGGYTLELEVPLSYTGGRLGFFLIDESRDGARTSIGNVARRDPAPPPWLIYQQPTPARLIKPFSQPHNHIVVADRERWLIAEQQANTRVADNQPQTFWLLRLLYRSILNDHNLQTPPDDARDGTITSTELETALQGKPSQGRYRDKRYSRRTLLVAAAPIRDDDGITGAVLLQQSGENYLSLTDQAFSRLLVYSLLAIGLGAAGLLGYATILSMRVRSLSQAASQAIAEDGRVAQAFRVSNANDELGDLSRHYAQLLGRVREYNDYLRSLSRKLSHELRTPIAVIQSSLDNLEHHSDDGQSSDHDTTSEDQATYILRARSGLERLQHILRAMSEAHRLEESIERQALEALNLVPLLKEIFQAYQDVYDQHNLRLSLIENEAWIAGNADLIVQALDKLMDNAASFCPLGADITLSLQEGAKEWIIDVQNQGPHLPESIAESLFSPMVSQRDNGNDDLHLGLGLHIVRLIAQFHRGAVSARNLEPDRGVAVTLRIPKQAAPPR